MTTTSREARLELRIDPPTLDRFRTAARRRGTTVSSWLRSLGLAEVEREEQASKPGIVIRQGVKPCAHPMRLRVGDAKNFCGACQRYV